jgi:hypothetical protein
VITVRALRWGILLGYLGGPNVITKVVIREVVSVKSQRRRLTVEVQLGIMESHEPRNGDSIYTL